MFKPGQQIVYVPMHANGDVNHKDVEHGFIVKTSAYEDSFFCRYWVKGQEGISLRTTANSELTNIRDMVEKDSCSQDIVKKTMMGLGYLYEY